LETKITGKASNELLNLLMEEKKGKKNENVLCMRLPFPGFVGEQREKELHFPLFQRAHVVEACVFMRQSKFSFFFCI
jgi:hypothetical protein